jgi:hypothetical protein
MRFLKVLLIIIILYNINSTNLRSGSDTKNKNKDLTKEQINILKKENIPAISYFYNDCK